MSTGGAHCTHCGAEITAGARFCMKCGADVSGEQARVATRTAPGAEFETTAARPPQEDLMEALREITLGDYEILAELGRGGMATVYLAHDIQLDRKVAIKLMSPHLAFGEGMVERFKLEARTAAGLSHPHIIPIYAVREVDDLFYFVMKFIEGRPLDSIIKEAAPLPVPMVRTIVSKIGEALGYAHRRGVIHRDIKPANIMIDTEGMPIVTDFGIAKVADRQGLTMTGATMGTPTYMSPEQCNADVVTGASDQYSLGVMAYEMLTGRPPYEGESVMTIMFKHCHGPVPVPESFGPHVPLELAQAVVRMLAKDPRHRWATIEEALPHIGGPTLAYDDPVRTQMIEFALAGANRQILARVSTPISPIPVGLKPEGPQPPRARPVSSPARPRGGVPAATEPMKPARRSRAGVVGAVAAVLVVVAAVLAVVRPWRGRTGVEDQPPEPTVLAADSAPAGPVAAAAVPESTPRRGGEEQQTPPSTPAPATPPATQARPPAAPVVREVRILGAPPTVPMGATVPLQAVVLDQEGRRMGRRVQWSSSSPGVAQVGADGRLRAVAPGRATISAEVDGRRAQTDVTITAVVAAVDVTPPTAQLQVGGMVVLVATPRGPDGRALADRAVTWRSSNETVAVVSTAGRVTGVGAGTATVSAVSEGRVGSAELTVAAPVAARVEPPPSAAPPVVAEDPSTAIGDVVRGYAQALQAKNMARVKALYPEIPAATEQQIREALQTMEDLQVSLAASSITVNGTNARARVTGTWVWKGGRKEQNYVFVFERRADGWVIMAMNQGE